MIRCPRLNCCNGGQKNLEKLSREIADLRAQLAKSLVREEQMEREIEEMRRQLAQFQGADAMAAVKEEQP